MVSIDDKIKFKRKIVSMGGSIGMTIPKELLEYVSLKDGDEVVVIGDESKHGKFIAIFKE